MTYFKIVSDTIPPDWDPGMHRKVGGGEKGGKNELVVDECWERESPCFLQEYGPS